MTVELNLTQLIFILAAVFSGLWALGKAMAAQYEKAQDKRFVELIESVNKAQEFTRTLERALLVLQGELPRVYLRREDYLREMHALTESIQREIAPMRISVNRIEDFLLNQKTP